VRDVRERDLSQLLSRHPSGSLAHDKVLAPKTNTGPAVQQVLGRQRKTPFAAVAVASASFLILAGWRTWITANIGYHPIHRPYRRAPKAFACFNAKKKYAALFRTLRRDALRQIPAQPCPLTRTAVALLANLRLPLRTESLRSGVP